jgi:hypothetical protein
MEVVKEDESHNPDGPYRPLANRSSQNFFMSIDASTFGVVAISVDPEPDVKEASAAIPEDIDSFDSLDPRMELSFLDVVVGLEWCPISISSLLESLSRLLWLTLECKSSFLRLKFSG